MKSVVIIMVSALLMMPILFTVSSCEENALQTRVTDGGGTGTGDSKPIMQTRRSECTSNNDDKCEGTQGTQCDNNTSYCGYSTVENKDNDTCSEVCRDLFTTKDARDTCLEYKPEIIFDVKELVDLLKLPTEEKLEGEVDRQTLCVLLKIGPDPWIEEIKDYRSSKAKTVFKWMVDENISSYFVEDDHQKDFMEHLFSSLGGEKRITSDNIFDGFKEEIEDDNDEELPALFYLSENDGSRSSEAFQFVHELILVDEVCKKSNRPEANVAVRYRTYNTCGRDNNKLCYGQDRETSVTGITDRVSTADAEKYFNLEACILGVYCHIATLVDDDEFDPDDLRENVADILSDGEVTDFIKTDVADGGLGLDDDDDDADDWTDTACDELKKYWNDNNDLDLGLGS